MPRVIGLLLASAGIAMLILATIYSSSIPALIGLGLTFWGIILMYVQTDEYVKDRILNATVSSLTKTLNQTLNETEFKGKAVYLPPKYFNDSETVKVFLLRQEPIELPTPIQTKKLETQPISKDGQAILLNPPGGELTRLFEKSLKTSFNNISLKELQRMLPKLIIEDIEIATALEIDTAAGSSNQPAGRADQPKQNTVKIRITTEHFTDIFKQVQQLNTIYANMGCPLTSAFASAIAKATGKPTIIQTQDTAEDGRTMEAVYLTLEEGY
jgi:hypothetical protein